MAYRTTSQARITSFDDPYERGFHDSWAADDARPPSRGVHAPPEISYLASPGFDASYPFSPSLNNNTPGLPPVAEDSSHGGGIYADHFSDSPLNSPNLTSFPRGAEAPRAATARTATLPTSPPPAASIDDVGHHERTRRSSYAIPPPPPPPFMGEQTAYEPVYEPVRGESHHAAQGHNRRGSQGLGRKLSHKIRSSFGGNRLSDGSGRWGTVRRRDSVLEEHLEGNDAAGNYIELRPMDREETIDVDISTLGPEFAVPDAAAKAMKSQNYDGNKAYTGSGKVVDLDTLTGWNDDWARRKNTEGFSPLDRAGTMENTESQSYYFLPVRSIPNWKPVALRTWFLVGLILLTVGLAVGVEILYQYSDKAKKTEDDIGGLYSYININELTTIQFAGWKYLPTLVGVLFGIIWKVTDEGLKRGEPYYQLSKGRKGALASESLNIEYHTIWSPFVPITAIHHKQFVVAAGGFLSTLASAVVPVLLSVFIRVDPNQDTRQRLNDEDKVKNAYEKMVKRIVIDAKFTRLLEATLVVIIGLGCYILVKVSRRKSGLLGDPSGIAGVAAMANKSHILMDFKGLDLATEATIHKQLNKRTYILHKGALWQAQLLKEDARDKAVPKAMNPHPLLLRIKGMGPFILFCLAILIVIPIIPENADLNNLVDNAPWLITGLSVLLKSIWELVEKDMRMLEPFWILFNRQAHSSVLTLDYTATIPGFIVLKAFYKGHYLLAWVTFVTLLIEILTVVMGSLGFQTGEGFDYGEESKVSAEISKWLAIGILVILILSDVLVLWYRRYSFLPRQPGTISSVLAFIHQSRMLMDFEGTEEKSTFERKQILNKLGKKYGFGWYLGRDGKRHLGIDQEPLLERYVFGVDPRQGVLDSPPTGWDTYENTAV